MEYLSFLEEEINNAGLRIRIINSYAYYPSFELTDSASSFSFQTNLTVNAYQRQAFLGFSEISGSDNSLEKNIRFIVEKTVDWCLISGEINSIITEDDSALFHSILPKAGYSWVAGKGILNDTFNGDFFQLPLNKIGKNQMIVLLSYVEAIRTLKEKDSVLFQTNFLDANKELKCDLVYLNVKFKYAFSLLERDEIHSIEEKTAEILASLQKEYEREKIRQVTAENTPFFNLFYSDYIDVSHSLRDKIKSELLYRYERDQIEEFFMKENVNCLMSNVALYCFFMFPVCDSYVVITYMDEDDHSFSLFSSLEEATADSNRRLNEALFKSIPDFFKTS